jgi:hypothetical protein
MKARSILLLLLCVFIVGVFFGIWMDWSVWKHKVGVRDIVYQVQNYPMANLVVHAGDKISLVPPAGGHGSGLTMSFVGGYSPCVPGGDPATCTIDAAATAGPYLFTCSSPKGYSCPDPGIQQSPTGPLVKLSFGRAVERDFAHLFGVRHLSEANPEPAKTNAGHPASSAITAYVSCLNGTTALNDPNGKSLTTITASSGQSVYWISPKPFALNTSSFPAGLCSNGNPGNGSTQEAQCDIALTGKTIQYGCRRKLHQVAPHSTRI